MRKTKNNPLLLGEAGVGKTAIIEGFAQKIVDGDVPERLKGKQIYMVDVGSLIAGTKYRGEFEARLKAIVEEAADPQNNIIMFIDEVHTIIGAGSAEGTSDAANMLKPLLARGKIQLIGATTFDEYQKYIEKDPALKRRFQDLMVNEPSRDDAIMILKGIQKRFEDFHGVRIQQDAITKAVDYSIRYMMNKYLPDKAIDIIDEACARLSTLHIKLDNDKEYKATEAKLLVVTKKLEKIITKQDYFSAAGLKDQEDTLKEELKKLRSMSSLPEHLRPEVGVDNIGQVLADKMGIPVMQVTENEVRKLAGLDAHLKTLIYGQDVAVDIVVKAIKRSRISVIESKKPIASFLFL
jgi:ATP-dependent Clp protease ATP-binding subunit ClpC